jgi:hypothetical protein
MHVFFDIHQKERYAGFKSMPDRHQNIRQFLTYPSMQVITLWREDVASTVASFMKAQETGCWRRDGASGTDKQWPRIFSRYCVRVK